MNVSMVSPRAYHGACRTSGRNGEPLLVFRPRRFPAFNNFHFAGSEHGELVLQIPDDAAAIAVHHWDGSAPIALAGDKPVSKPLTSLEQKPLLNAPLDHGRDSLRGEEAVEAPRLQVIPSSSKACSIVTPSRFIVRLDNDLHCNITSNRSPLVAQERP